MQQAADQESARNGWPAGRPWRASAPYLLIAVVVVSDWLVARDLSVGAFLVLAPLLAGRLFIGRDQVLASGLAALGAGLAAGLYLHKVTDEQLGARLVLIALGTMLTLLSQGAYRRERSAFGRAADTITIAASLAAGVEPEQAYELLARSARKLYEAAAVAVYRRHGERMVVVAQHREEAVPPLPPRLHRATFPAAFSTGPERIGGRAASAPEAHMLQARGLASLLWLPLIDAAGYQTGTILLTWRQRDPRLSANDLEASMRFASLGARAISGSERVQAQAEVLDQIQALLLSTPPAWAAGYRVAVRYQSASTLAEIGGDFYDVVELDREGLAFIMADARGKGLEASSLAAVLKGAFRSLAGEAAGPAAILSRLDRLVAREGGDEDFVTALVGRVYPNGRVVLASAGHPPPLGLARLLVPKVAAPLGLGTRAEDAFGLLRPGHRLICYTDGLVEARNRSGEFIDSTRFDAAVASGALDEVLDRLVAMVDEHSDGRYADDLALLGLEYAPRPLR
ncbi:MAG TPA: PP2C family protein-serine/threonine phosphatase [Actinomycetes bacterium]|nr:PP2C family protein-serine/threonine phosphatase [Actinomycetes bacterium]